jgi:hypothetical protein
MQGWFSLKICVVHHVNGVREGQKPWHAGRWSQGVWPSTMTRDKRGKHSYENDISYTTLNGKGWRFSPWTSVFILNTYIHHCPGSSKAFSMERNKVYLLIVRSWFSCLSLLSVWIIGVCCHTWFALYFYIQIVNYPKMNFFWGGWYWDLNSGPTPWATLPALLWWVFLS